MEVMKIVNELGVNMRVGEIYVGIRS